MSSKISNIHKHTFDITGTRPLVPSIKEKLDAMSNDNKLEPVTALITEVPTNPDMKVPNIKELCTVLS